MEFETTETVRSTPSRHEKSLGLLTMKFVSLLQEAKDGVLDLKVVSGTSRVASVVLRVVVWFFGELKVLPGSGGEQRATAQVPVSHKRGRWGAVICLTGGLSAITLGFFILESNNNSNNSQAVKSSQNGEWQ